MNPETAGGMTQLSLADALAALSELGAQVLTEAAPGRVHRDGHDTERAAAASVAQISGALRTVVYALLRAHPDGLTDDQGGQLMAQRVPGADRLTFGRRRQELARVGLVIDSGRRAATPRGRTAIVWRAVAG